MAFVYSRVKFVYAHMEFDMILNTDKSPLTKYSYKNMTERKKELITTRKFSVKKNQYILLDLHFVFVYLFLNMCH